MTRAVLYLVAACVLYAVCVLTWRRNQRDRAGQAPVAWSTLSLWQRAAAGRDLFQALALPIIGAALTGIAALGHAFDLLSGIVSGRYP